MELSSPVDDKSIDPEESTFKIPDWAYGAAAGGIAVLTTGAVGLYHWLSRRKRISEASSSVLEMDRQQLEFGTLREYVITPREVKDQGPQLCPFDDDCTSTESLIAADPPLI